MKAYCILYEVNGSTEKYGSFDTINAAQKTVADLLSRSDVEDIRIVQNKRGKGADNA